MTITHIIIKESAQDSFTPALGSSDKRIAFDVGSSSPLVSSYINIILSQKKTVPQQQAADFLDLATAVYTTDQVVSRDRTGFQGWSRHIRVYFPVADKALWDGVQKDVEQMLSFLSGDKWEIFFRQRATARVIQPPLNKNPEGITKVSLLSGGLDSFIGAIDLLEAKEKVAFVSHYKRGSEGKVQTVIQDALNKQYGASSSVEYKFFVQPTQNHVDAAKESSSRARSFLFLGLGLAIANALEDNIDLIVPENGLISLNVPLTQTRLSSHSTRTTHPYYLSLFRKIASGLGISNGIVNPYQLKTKGEMMNDCKNKNFLQQHNTKTLSCSHGEISHYIPGTSPGIHCGYCVPCIIRQAAEKAAGITKTTYTHKIKFNAPKYSTKKGRDLRAFKMALEEIKGLPKHSVALHILKPGPLPFNGQKELDDYIGIYLRGMEEVNNFLK